MEGKLVPIGENAEENKEQAEGRWENAINPQTEPEPSFEELFNPL